MEESWIQPIYDMKADENMALFNKEKAIVYNLSVIQKDRLNFLNVNYIKN